jgi:hypothetical protein
MYVFSVCISASALSLIDAGRAAPLSSSTSLVQARLFRTAYVCMHMYACVYVHTYVFMLVRTYVRTYVRPPVPSDLSRSGKLSAGPGAGPNSAVPYCICMYVRTYVRACVRAYVRAYVRMCMYEFYTTPRQDLRPSVPTRPPSHCIARRLTRGVCDA